MIESDNGWEGREEVEKRIRRKVGLKLLLLSLLLTMMMVASNKSCEQENGREGGSLSSRFYRNRPSFFSIVKKERGERRRGR